MTAPYRAKLVPAVFDTRHNLTSPVHPPCLVTENGASCDREGVYWLVVSEGRTRIGLGACVEHVAELRTTPAERRPVIEQITTRHPFYGEAGANDG